jgi:hypothetical protein
MSIGHVDSLKIAGRENMVLGYNLHIQMAKNYSATKHLYTLNDSVVPLRPRRRAARRRSRPATPSTTRPSTTTTSTANTRSTLDDSQMPQKKRRAGPQTGRTPAQKPGISRTGSARRTPEPETLGKAARPNKETVVLPSQQPAAGLRPQETAAVREGLGRDAVEIREHKKVSDGHTIELKQLIKKVQTDKEKFLGFLRSLMEMLRRCDKPEEYLVEKDKILGLLGRNLSQVDTSKLGYDFDFKFEFSRVDTLKEKIRALEREVEDSHEALERERGERKKVMAIYNEKVSRLR